MRIGTFCLKVVHTRQLKMADVCVDYIHSLPVYYARTVVLVRFLEL